jgi:hypothetical protein
VTLISLDDGEKLAGLEKIVETVGDELEVVGDVVDGVVAETPADQPPADATGEPAGEA